jgi:hypothetical protein
MAASLIERACTYSVQVLFYVGGALSDFWPFSIDKVSGVRLVFREGLASAVFKPTFSVLGMALLGHCHFLVRLKHLCINSTYKKLKA